jgi:hypothetical protein
VRAGYANLLTHPSQCEVSGEVSEGIQKGKGEWEGAVEVDVKLGSYTLSSETVEKDEFVN